MNTQIYEEASDWLVRTREGDLDAREKQRFDAWLRESPQHVGAYLEISAVWEDVASLDPSLNAGAEELIARARSPQNVVSLSGFPRAPDSGSGQRHPSAQPTRLSALKRTQRVLTGALEALASAGGARSFALATSVLLTIAGTWLYSQRNTYTTGVGEQRSIALSDGSTVELNSRSRVRVRFSEAERDIDLIAGQALFRVAKNPLRPFVVSAGGTHVRALGTQFDVYRRKSGTVVTVVEGKVAVYGEPRAPSAGVPVTAERNDPRSGNEKGLAPPDTDSANGAIFLAAGEQATVTPATTAATSPKRANVAAATAWTQRALVFDSSTLTEVTEEFNRYNELQLVIKDSELANMHVSGVFSSVDPALLLRFLRTQPGLVIEETDREIRISKKK